MKTLIISSMALLVILGCSREPLQPIRGELGHVPDRVTIDQLNRIEEKLDILLEQECDTWVTTRVIN